MRDKRPVDELSVDELERILAIRRREQRQERLRRYDGQGRRLPVPAEAELPRQHEAAENLPPLEPPVTYDITDDVPRFEDEVEEERPRKQTPRPFEMAMPAPVQQRSRQRAAWDRFLLTIEVLGVLAFVGLIGYGGYYLARENDKIDQKMDALKNESAAMQQEYQAMRATPTPAPELRVQIVRLSAARQPCLTRRYRGCLGT